MVIESLYLSILLFILGACFGSFVNVIIDRIPRRKSIVLSRSHCDSCGRKIPEYDLIPILSYAILGGKCRYCKAKIPTRVFLVEILSGLLFVFVFLFSSYSLITLPFLAAFCLLALAIAVIDMEHGIIPDQLLIALGALTLGYLLVSSPYSIGIHIASGVLAFLFFFAIFLGSRGRGIGFGDVKYAFFIGFLLSGIETIIALYIAFLTGALISIILIVVGKKRFRKSTIVFGPFLSLGVILALLFENQIVELVFPLMGIR